MFDKIFLDNDEIKLGYLNIRGLLESNHGEYLDNDNNLLDLDLLVVAETWLNNEVSNKHLISKLKNWTVVKRLDATDCMKHMGLLLLHPKSRVGYEDLIYDMDYTEEKRKQ